MEYQEDVWACPIDLLCISWGSLEDQIDCLWQKLGECCLINFKLKVIILLTKWARTWRACRMLVSRATSGKQAKSLMAWLCVIHTNKQDFRFVFVWCNLLVHQTHGGISGEFGVESESRANGISQEIPEQMKFLGNLVWRTFSKNCWIFAKWDSERCEIPHSLVMLGLCHKQITNQWAYVLVWKMLHLLKVL